MLDERARILGVKLCGETCRAYEITEHHGDRTTLGSALGDSAGAGLAGLGGGFPGLESGNRLEETLAVPQRHADLFKVDFDQVPEDARVDLMRAEQRFVLSEASIAFSHWATFIVVPLHGSISKDATRETESSGREVGKLPLWGRC